MTDTSMIDDDDLFDPAETPEPEPEHEEEEFDIVFDGDAAPADETAAPAWVKDLRVKNRQLAQRNAELEAQTAKEIEIGPKPTLESCEYDGDRFETELDEWKDRQRQAGEVQTRAQQAQNTQVERFQRQLTDLAAKEQALKAPGYAEARDTVVSSLSVAQQALLVKSAGDGAKVIYALGKHPDRLATLAAIDDAVDFVKAIVELERGMKMTSRKRAPEPETLVRGSAPLAKVSASVVEKGYERLIESGTADERKAYRQRYNLDVNGKREAKR